MNWSVSSICVHQSPKEPGLGTTNIMRMSHTKLNKQQYGSRFQPFTQASEAERKQTFCGLELGFSEDFQRGGAGVYSTALVLQDSGRK